MENYKFKKKGKWNVNFAYAGLLLITIIFHIQDNDWASQKTPVFTVPDIQDCQPRYEPNIRLFCFKDTDTGSWMLVYNEKGTFELLPTYNNTCWFKPKDINFKKGVL